MGTVLFRALSGRLPFDAESTASLLYRIAHERPPTLASLDARLPRQVALAIDRALEPDLRLRYPSMEAFARGLAIAAQQDSLSLPSDPDPLGLPDFACWLAESDVLRTAPVGETAPAVVVAQPAAAPVPAASRSSRSRRLLNADGSSATPTDCRDAAASPGPAPRTEPRVHRRRARMATSPDAAPSPSTSEKIIRRWDW